MILCMIPSRFLPVKKQNQQSGLNKKWLREGLLKCPFLQTAHPLNS